MSAARNEEQQMGLPNPPWYDVLVRYCPRCRRESPPTEERCDRCGRPLVDRMRREKVEDR